MTSPSRPRVRAARPADVPELLEMMADFNRGEGIRFRRPRARTALQRLLRAPRLGMVMVAETPGRPGRDGYAVATFGYDLEFDGTDAFLTELYVRPEHRRLGLGARLLDAVARALRGAGARAVTLLVWPENRAARRLYDQAGFAQVRRVAMIRRLAR